MPSALAAASGATPATPLGAHVLRAPLRTFNVSTALLRNFDVVHVAFAFEDAKESARDADDRVAAYCLDGDSNANAEDGGYMDSQTTGRRASGVLAFGPMVNMRCVWQFRFLAKGRQVLATSPLVRFVNGPSEPTQIHLAPTTKLNEMLVTWTSGGGLLANPVVQYGASNTSLTLQAVASSTSYSASDMCAGPATTVSPRYYRDPGHMYTAVMAGLEPNAVYFYRVGDASKNESVSTGSMSDVQQLVVPPAPGTVPSPSSTMSFVVFGDLAATATATGDFMVQGGCGTTMQHIERDIVQGLEDETHVYTAVFHVGDLSYARGSTFLWDQFGFLIQGAASRVPYMISVGNHDYGYQEGENAAGFDKYSPNPIFEDDRAGGFDSGGECGVPMSKRFQMPANGNGVFWYSTEMGLTHHTVLSSEHDFRRGSPMYSWLLKDLRSVNRTTTPWLFLHIHRPLYCSETYTSDYRRSLLLRNHLEHLLDEFRVDVVFSGHYHSYERTCPVYDEQCFYGATLSVAQAPVHIMVGSGGANVDSEGYYDRDWSLRVLQEYGYGRVHVYNATHMHFEFVANEMVENGGVKDLVWVVSDHAWPNGRPRQNRTMPFSIWEIAAMVALAALLLVLTRMALKWRRAAALQYFRQLKTASHKKRRASAEEIDDENTDAATDQSDRLLLAVR
ncbi:hypothetical protein Gpo141_00003265 [Globisporangium polare]